MKYETYVDYRDAKSMKDHQISKMCGIPKSTFSAWKHGLYTPKADKLLKVAKVLGIPRRLVLEPDSTKDGRRSKYNNDPSDSG